MIFPRNYGLDKNFNENQYNPFQSIHYENNQLKTISY